MKILAIDLGKFKSVACVYESTTGEHSFLTVSTTPADFQDLFAKHKAHRVVIEIGSAAGRVHDMALAMGLEIQVANPSHEAWRWKNVKRKTDKGDALKLAQLSAMNQIPMIQIPSSRVRQWRSLINYRWTLIRRRTMIKNHIRSILDRQGLAMPGGKSAWTDKSIAALKLDARTMEETKSEELWRFELHMELTALEQLQTLMSPVEDQLEELAKLDARVRLLQTIPGVGPRLAEVVVAMIDDPKRFKNAKQVGAYAGLVPKPFESGQMCRQGGISGEGNKLLRALLVEVSWLMRRYNKHLSAIFDNVCHGTRTRRKVAVVATARRLIIICWAMLRDNKPWKEPTSVKERATLQAI
jgi:transposase